MPLDVSRQDLPPEEGPSIASFVIRLQAPPGDPQLVPISAGGKLGWLGRVEHVQSRRSLTFDNPEAMIRFIEACLAGQEPQPAP